MFNAAVIPFSERQVYKASDCRENVRKHTRLSAAESIHESLPKVLVSIEIVDYASPLNLRQDEHCLIPIATFRHEFKWRIL